MENTQGTFKQKQEWSVTYKQLGVLILAFSLGMISALLFSNASISTDTTFSTTQLIGFVLTVILSGASIVLAIAAIALGKTSEQSVIQRSDESIRLQNEVFQKTMDALQRIESSTGVTEKRIEDIISGRVGDLSQKIAGQIATDKQEAQDGLSAQEIGEMIKKTLYQSLREEGVLSQRTTLSIDEEYRFTEMEKKERIRKKKIEKYETFHKCLLTSLSSRKDLTSMKMGTGEVNGSGDDLFDGIYLRKDGKRIGVLDFADHHQVQSVRKMTLTALYELQKGSMAHVYVILFGTIESFEQEFADVIALADSGLKKRISITVCPPDKIEETAEALVIADN